MPVGVPGGGLPDAESYATGVWDPIADSVLVVPGVAGGGDAAGVCAACGAVLGKENEVWD